MAGIFKPIDPNDQTITPFKVYKSWEYTGTVATNYSGFISESISISTAIKPDPTNFSDGKIPLDFDEECNLDPASYLLNYTNKNIPAGILWYGLKHSYFNDYLGHSAAGGAYPDITSTSNLETWRGVSFKPVESSSLKTYDLIENEINPSSSCELGSIATVISIPQLKFGEEIKPGSLEMELTNTTFGNTNIITDDGKGNLISNLLTPVPKVNNRLIYLGFNESEYDTIANTTKADPRYPTELSFYNIIPTRSFIEASSLPLGIAANFSHSYIQIDGTPSYFNPNIDDNYAVSFWFKLDTLSPGHGQSQHMVSKRSLSRNYQLIDPSGRSNVGNIWRPNSKLTPYDIFVSGSKLCAQFGDGSTLKTIVNSGTVVVNTAHHVVFQKTGSTYELYLDSTSTTTTANLSNITNKADIFIGCKGLDVMNNNEPVGPIIGKMDEIQIFNTGLTPTEISKLRTKTTLNNSYNVGKIFYKQGLIVITGLHPSLGNIVNASVGTNLLFPKTLYNNSTGAVVSNNGQISSATIRWNSTVTLYENEILCRIREDEYNFTLNPSILKNMENSQLPKEFVYNDEFTPYITTIGLYNENAELLAIGKLAGPIKKRNNVDLNIIVRFDQ